MAKKYLLIWRSLSPPTRSTAVRVLPSFEPMAAKPHCRRCRALAVFQRRGTRSNGHQTTSDGFKANRRRSRMPGPAVLDMGNLKFGRLTGQNRKILAPVELERISRRERHWAKRPTSRCLLLMLLIYLPFTGKRCDPIVGPNIAQLNQILMQLLRFWQLLARPPSLIFLPSRKFANKKIKFAVSF